MIIVFSGTGNSRMIARMLSDATGDCNVVELRGKLLTEPETARLNAGDDRHVIWVFPAYGWGVPPMVEQFMKAVVLESDSEPLQYMVATCGDDIGLTDHQWKRLITMRGWRAGAAYSVTMPNTYICLPGFDVDPTELEEAKLSAAVGRVKDIASRIMRDDTDDSVVRGNFAHLKSDVIKPFFNRFLMSPKGFSVDAKLCIACGKCESLCPAGNIRIDDSGLPHWGDSCAFCLACYHVCPKHAVSHGRSSRGKGQKKILR